MKIQNNGDYYNFSGGEVFADLHQLIHYYSVGEGKDHLVETNSKSIKLQKPLCVPSHRSERCVGGYVFGSSVGLALVRCLNGVGCLGVVGV